MTAQPPTVPLNRWLLAGALGLLTAIGLGTKHYRGPLESWVRHHLGDVLVVVFLIGVARWIWPRRSARVLSGGVLAVAFAIECLQLWQPPFLQAIRATVLGQIIFGSYFDGWDFLHYGVGAWLGYGGLYWLDRPAAVPPAPHPDQD